MNKKIIIATILGLIIIASVGVFYFCPLNKTVDDEGVAGAPKLLSTHLKMKKWRNKACTEDTLECAIVRIQYLQFEDSIRPNLALQFNDTITALLQRAMAGNAETESTLKPLDELAQRFLDDYDEENSIDPTYPWNMDISLDLINQTPAYISIEESTSSYTGGAHPSTYTAIHNYERKTGHLLTLNDLVLDPKKFLFTAERAFRKANDMAEGEDFFDKGFEMDSLFVIAQNFAIEQEGLNFLYNPYEIAPYSMGTIEFSIPYEQLKGIIKPEFIPKDNQ